MIVKLISKILFIGGHYICENINVVYVTISTIQRWVNPEPTPRQVPPLKIYKALGDALNAAYLPSNSHVCKFWVIEFS